MGTSLGQQEPSGECLSLTVLDCLDLKPMALKSLIKDYADPYRVWEVPCRYAANGAGIVLAFGGTPVCTCSYFEPCELAT